ncbi:putative ribonuclease H-like domain-containing protein [Tanacetum coccineum]|uniref:Ribonuclease H-like domain-containing protein n=1 Tax=Tanacetum coccineum TaxID=301880 RepID=A0ABQ5GC11_9ASTR
MGKPVWNNAQMVNHQNFAKKTHPYAKKNMVLRAVLMKSGLVSINIARQNISKTAVLVNTARQVNTAHSKTTMNAARLMSYISKIAHLTVKRPIHKNTTFKNSNINQRVNTVRGKKINIAWPKAVVNAVKGNNFNDVKASTCWVWKPKHKVLDHDNPQMDLQDQGVIDSGCSRHMKGNMPYLTDYEEIDRGYVAFGGNPKGGKITGKCTIKTGNLDFENVYFMRELKFNLLSVSQMCDKKNSVLFNDTECIVLSPNIKLIDESQVLLRVPRKNNMYSVDLKNIVLKGGLTCLFAKATSDESKLWHRRLGHLNFKTMNKLVKGNLVRGLPSKLFKNDQTCVACQKGKQHRAFCKSKIENSISLPLHLLHMDLFGLTFVKSLMKKMYCLVVTDDYSMFTWVFFLATKDETSGILKSFINEIKNLVDHKVKVIRCDNGTVLKNREMNKFCEIKGILRQFSVARTPQQNGVAERRNMILIEAARTMLADSKLPTTFWFFVGLLPLNSSGPDWLFDIDALTRTMNYEPIVKGTQSNGFVGTKASDNVDPKSSHDDGSKPSSDDGKKVDEDPRKESECNDQEKEDNVNSTNNVNAAGTNEVNAVGEKKSIELPFDPNMPALEDYNIFNFSIDDEDDGVVADMNNLDTTIQLYQVYVDDIIFGSTKNELCFAFEKLMHEKFQMSSMGELTFFLGLQVHQKKDGIFICQDKYVVEILKKFGFIEVKNASTPMETQKPLQEVDVHMYRSMIGSLMYLTSSRPDIMFVVCAYARYQVNLKISHLHAVKRIFRYLKGQPKLGLWYPKDSPFNLVAYTDSDYAGASLDRKSTTGGCQFLGCRLISWQCKKQTVVANSTTEAEYVAAIQVKTINGEAQLHALVDDKKIIVTKSSVRRDLQLADEEGDYKSFKAHLDPVDKDLQVVSEPPKGLYTILNIDQNLYSTKSNNHVCKRLIIFSFHDDRGRSLHDDASLDGSVPASNKGDAPAKPPQIHFQTLNCCPSKIEDLIRGRWRGTNLDI